MTDGGFAFGLPRVSTAAKTIVGAFTPAVGVSTGAVDTWSSSYDAVAVTLDGLGAGRGAAGPDDHRPGLPVRHATPPTWPGRSRTPLTFAAEGDVWTAAADGTTYGLVVSGDATVDGGTLTLPAGGERDLVPRPRRRVGRAAGRAGAGAGHRR